MWMTGMSVFWKTSSGQTIVQQTTLAILTVVTTRVTLVTLMMLIKLTRYTTLTALKTPDDLPGLTVPDLLTIGALKDGWWARYLREGEWGQERRGMRMAQQSGRNNLPSKG